MDNNQEINQCQKNKDPQINIYCGINAHDVTVNGKPLNPCNEIANYSNGFSWGYTGSGPMQLALAICIHEFGEELNQHPICYSLMKSDLIGHFHRLNFTLTSTQIQTWIKTHKPDV